MSYDWKKTRDGIGVVYENKVVRINNDDVLHQKLKKGGHKASHYVAMEIRQRYEEQFGKPIDITTRSLGVEIFWHYKIERFCLMVERILKRRTRLTKWLILHMDVIDCGEKSEDNNRFVWDFLAKFRPDLKRIKEVKNNEEVL